jgi:hypothetical protein
LNGLIYPIAILNLINTFNKIFSHYIQEEEQMNYNYIAIIGELKNSKNLENRNEVQIKLENVLKKINSSYSDQIASNFTITLGDEFQGLLSESSNVMYIMSEIEKVLYPVKFRFGVGIGTITTRINRELAIGADGPAYQRARTAMIRFVKMKERTKQAMSISELKHQTVVI